MTAFTLNTSIVITGIAEHIVPSVAIIGTQSCEDSLGFSSCLVVAEPRTENWLFPSLSRQMIPQRFGH